MQRFKIRYDDKAWVRKVVKIVHEYGHAKEEFAVSDDGEVTSAEQILSKKHDANYEGDEDVEEFTEILR